jgi:hypothetical protein
MIVVPPGEYATPILQVRTDKDKELAGYND